MNPSSESLQYRPAVLADVPQLCELLSQLFAQESDFSPDTNRQTLGLEMILGDPAVGRLFCAVDGESVVGMVSILFTVSTAEGGRAAWLEDMVVRPDRRGLGIGDRLLQTAISGAKEAGCTRVTLLTDATNTPAQRFYARAGFARSQMIPLRLKL
jgi:GNAT superfamily N-acetyltransferase